MKRKVILPIIIGITIVVLSSSTIISSHGIYACTGSPVDGGSIHGTCGKSGCHGGGSTIPTVTITSSPAFGVGNIYTPNQTYTISVNASGSYPAYGFNCEIITSQSANTNSVTTFGIFGSAVSTNCQVYPFTTTHPSPMCVSHNTPSGSGNAAVFSFEWTAPSSGTGYLYCVCNGVNLSGDESGDRASAVKSLTLTPTPSGISSYTENENTLNVFPNPATDNLRLVYTLVERSCVVAKLCNLNGAVVANLINENQNRGEQSVDIHLPIGLLKGIYIIKLSINEKQTSKKLMVL